MTLSICLLLVRGALFRSDGVDRLEYLWPSLAHSLERKIVLRRTEAGMHQTDPGAAIDLAERPGDDRFQTRAVLGIGDVSAIPCVDQTLVRDHIQHLAMDHAVPFAGRRS